MTTRQNLNELISVLEGIRSTKYPDVPKVLVENIALAQYENQDDRSKARIRTMNIIHEYVGKITKEI